MTDDVFEQLAAVREGDEVRITLESDSATVRGAEFASPIVARVTSIDEETLDSRRKGVDVDGIVSLRTLHLEPIPDDAHDGYAIETRSPVVGDDSVSPLRARRRDADADADGPGNVDDLGDADERSNIGGVARVDVI